ncbi:MAG: hypothetical protein ABI785_13765 [Gemmatimonadales bacterium]
MRYLLYTAFALTACGRHDTARDARAADTSASPAPAPDRAMSAVADRLLGTWTAQGFDAGSTRAQQFTIAWARTPDGSLAGTIAFRPGETYTVKVVSTGDSTMVYESEPHHSPTLKEQVVTRTQAHLVGDSLVGTYEARGTKGGKVLRGRFTAKHE